ncbi:hypothetical protein DSM03_11439 [Leeuwenhoekiella aestuarii]|uniref:Protein required for attachment to host cells n=1 Tax=Leeuwenhoekiella aestuarii TaxID=2249426 RepID=A0A4Q0NVM7_9FLAO|nr:hypothetical protein [Leeuwenhoekiella aestuarii]RXG11662.1 hypothetical protein DSM03_11439 [Leeuwenhoekiella aestuarii]RXG15127.1 hypothetical protein DSM04_10314 [Leeuwenhoekiella aestuarii]
METPKNLGIWMDHAMANLIHSTTKRKNKNITSKFTAETKEEVLNRSEKSMHNKRQQMNEAYYKEIADAILNYNHVLLFGPTDAKTELYNFLSTDSHFKNIRIDIESADKMTDSEKHLFIKNHFSRRTL